MRDCDIWERQLTVKPFDWLHVNTSRAFHTSAPFCAVPACMKTCALHPCPVSCRALRLACIACLVGVRVSLCVPVASVHVHATLCPACVCLCVSMCVMCPPCHACVRPVACLCLCPVCRLCVSRAMCVPWAMRACMSCALCGCGCHVRCVCPLCPVLCPSPFFCRSLLRSCSGCRPTWTRHARSSWCPAQHCRCGKAGGGGISAKRFSFMRARGCIEAAGSMLSWFAAPAFWLKDGGLA